MTIPPKKWLKLTDLAAQYASDPLNCDIERELIALQNEVRWPWYINQEQATEWAYFSPIWESYAIAAMARLREQGITECICRRRQAA